MSYDLHVYSQESLSSDSLRELVAAVGLGVDDAEGDAESLTVVRGAKGKYCFTLGLPVAVELEDVPEEVTSVLLAPAFLYELLVEGSSPTETPHAVRFARQLAQASSGVVLDQQTDQIWVRGQLRTPPAVQRGLIDIVEIEWYVRGDTDQKNAAPVWLDLTRRYLPEALPRRFGTYEPLQMKFSADEPAAFIDAVPVDHGSLFFKASPPCIEGHLAGNGTGRVVSHSLSLHRDPLRDPRWRAALRRLFVGFAVETGAFFGVAQVQRGLEWSGRSMWYGAEAETTTYLAARGTWAGLLPYPPWWAWFGPQYAPLVIGHLPEEQLHSVGDGLFHSRSEEPQDRDELLAAISVSTAADGHPRRLRRLVSRRASKPVAAAKAAWLPPDLLPTVKDTASRIANPPLVPAQTRPAELC